MRRTALKRQWVALILILVLTAGVGWLGGRRVPLPGALGRVAAGVRVGMPQAEVVALIQSSGSDNLDTYYVRGATRDGRPFSCCCGVGFDRLPTAEAVAWGELELDDEQGRELVITLGPGGVVSSVRLHSPRRLEPSFSALWRWLDR